jgi:N-acetylglucosaminyldiphosphoundecaprenol N-acetyl-beta-D-mannosaminyltransferase
MTRRVSILGVPVDRVTRGEALAMVLQMQGAHGQNIVMTPNPEMLVAAHRNREFFDLFNRSLLNIPDGAGLLWAAKRLGEPIPERVTGVDLMVSICDALDASTPVFLLGAAPGVADTAAEILRKRNPSLVIAGCCAGSPKDDEAGSIISTINASGAKFLFVAFGSPQQELWIDRHFSAMPMIKVAMGVGGSFDFIAGKQKRAPKMFQSLGIEWLWRLLQEPRRIGRICNAVIVFPYLVLTRRSHPVR